MVSGAGRKVFQPGEVLTASNVQNYLMDQAVQVYAGTAARGSAIGTATTEGMVSYLADTDKLQLATGTATWVDLYPAVPLSGQIVGAASYTYSSVISWSLTTGASTATPLSISYAMSSSTNYLILMGNVISSDSSGYMVSGFKFTAGGTAIGIGDAAGSRIRVTSSQQESASNNTSTVKSNTFMHKYSPGTTSSITYGIDIVNVATATFTHGINYAYANSDNSAFSRSISNISILEVKA